MSAWTRLRSWLVGAYDGANQSRFRSPKAGYVSLPEDEDRAVTALGREHLRLECRDLRRNNPIASGLCERFPDNVVGTGLKPQAKTTSADWNAAAESYFSEWAKIADFRGRINLWEMQRLAVMARLTDGEIAFVLTRSGQLQPIEAERIRTPSSMMNDQTVLDGVKLSAAGIKVGYYVHNRDRDGRFSGIDFEYVRAEDLIHVVTPKRTDQVRGIPELAAVVNILKDLDNYDEAVILKAIGEAKMFYQEIGDGAPAITQQARRYDTTSTVDPATEKIMTGEIRRYKAGRKLELIESKTPNSNYPPFTEQVIRRIGAAVGMPYEFVLLDFSRGSFSSSRAALLQTHRTFEQWQEWLIQRMMQRIWNWRIGKAIKDRQLDPAPVDDRGISQWYAVRWQRPEFGWVDPQSENQGHILAINAGAETLTEWCGRRGRDAEDVLEEKGSDIAKAMAVATQINKESPGANVTWRDLITTNLPGQVTRQDPQPSQRASE